jgi:protein O-GlcNAc transferase
MHPTTEPVQRNRDLYLDLIERCLSNTIYEDAYTDWRERGIEKKFDSVMRQYGRDWPRIAHTMIGHLRLRNLRDLAEQVLAEGIPGDFIETGVWRGGACILLRAVLKALGVTDRRVFAADSFAGLPKPDPARFPADEADSHHEFEELAVSLEEVQANFARYGLLDEQVVFLKGWFKDTLPAAPIESLALLRLDGDMYESTIDALRNLYDKVSPGGFVIVDDYGCVAGCRQAVDDFRRDRGIAEPMVDIDGWGVYWRKPKNTAIAAPALRSEPAASGPSPFWSVIVPLDERTAYLKQCLNSILDQDPGPHDMEILVIDDASPTDLRPVVERLGRGRVTYIRNETNLGLYPSTNAGIRRARGQWLHILHDDDWVLPEFYATMRRGIETSATNVGVAFSMYVNWHEPNGTTWSPPPFRAEAGLMGRDFLVRLSKANPLNLPAVIFRREAFERVGPFREDLPFTADWEWYVRSAVQCRWHHQPQPLACYRVHSATQTQYLASTGQTARDVRRTLELIVGVVPADVAMEALPVGREFHARQFLGAAVDFLQAGNRELGARFLSEALAIDAAAAARPEFSRLLQHPAAADIRHEVLGRAVAAFRDGRFSEAETLCQAVMAAKPDFLEALHLMADIQSALRRDAEALATCDKALAMRPNDAESLNKRGLALRNLGRIEEALASYDGALALKPDDADALNHRGNVLQRLRRLDEALASYDRALAIRPDFAAGWNNRGNILQLAERFDEAFLSYDRALEIRPDYAEALNNRGVGLYEVRRFQEALASFERALTIRTDYVAALDNRGNALRQLGRLEEALASYDRALAIRPDLAGARDSRSRVLMGLDRFEEALASYDGKLAICPDDADALNDRGNALEQLKRFEDALASYDRALAIQPDHFAALDNRGNMLQKLGRPEEAVASHDRALAIRPDNAEALNNRGNALTALSRLDEAIASFDSALAIRPDHAEVLNNRGNALKALDRFAEALADYDRALAIRPDLAEVHDNRASALQGLYRFDDALQSFDRALAIRPGFAEAHANRGLCLYELGRFEEARASYATAIELRPDFADARFALCMAELPIVYAHEPEIAERRAAYERRLKALCDAGDPGLSKAELSKGFGWIQPFYLAYQGYHDRDLQDRYGSFLCGIMARHYPPAAFPPPPQADEPVRVGIVSGFFRAHSNWKLPIKGWLSRLDRRRFRVFGYHTGTLKDAETGIAASMCERFVEGPLAVDGWRSEILADAPHVLIYPEIFMDRTAAALAAQRLAAVQCNSWGHPDTSGFPTLDYYLGSDLMEPQDGEDHYTEKLIRLPNLSVYCEPIDPPPATARPALGLRPTATVYWCCQSLFKYLPRFDEVFPRIAAAVPDCQFVFIEYQKRTGVTRLFRQRLVRAFETFGLKADRHCVFLGRLEQEEFIAATGACDVFLDSIGWSGCNSTLESLAYDLPIVTMAGALMRGRHSMAILSMMGVTETIAHTIDDYVSMAVRLARDEPWRMSVKAKIAATKHRVYRDDACIAGLERFLERAARGITAE